MGSSTIPAASAGAPITSWVQLATSSPTSGATVSFTSLSSYKQYRVVMSGVDVNTGGPNMTMTLNNTASNYSSAITYWNNNQSRIQNDGYNSTTSVLINPPSNQNTALFTFAAEILIDYANQSTPKSIRYSLGQGNTNSYPNAWAIWNNTATVNRIDFTLSSNSFAAGTFTVFGSN